MKEKFHVLVFTTKQSFDEQALFLKSLFIYLFSDDVFVFNIDKFSIHFFSFCFTLSLLKASLTFFKFLGVDCDTQQG